MAAEHALGRGLSFSQHMGAHSPCLTEMRKGHQTASHGEEI